MAENASVTGDITLLIGAPFHSIYNYIFLAHLVQITK